MGAPRALVVGALLAALALASGCGGPEAGSLEARAGAALDGGQPGQALDLLREAREPRLRALRGRARVALHHWGEAEREIKALGEDPAAATLKCNLAVARRDVMAEHLCRAATAADPGDLRAKLDLAAALDDIGRPEEGEKLLRDLLVDAHGDDRVWSALVDHFERFGWIREAVDTLAAWRIQHPFETRVTERLTAALLRKVRGDLLDKRWLEADVAARWLLDVAPAEGVARWYLADALDGLGKKAEAEAEREAAAAAGVPKPPPVNVPKELESPPEHAPHEHGPHGHGPH